MLEDHPDIARSAASAGRTALCSCHTTSMTTPAGGEIVVVRVFGDVDHSTVDVLQAALTEARDRHPSHIVVDVAGLLFCSARCPGYLLTGARPHLERLLALLAPSDFPVRYPTAGAAVLAAMADQSAGVAPGPTAEGRRRPGEVAHHHLTGRVPADAGDAYRNRARRHRTRTYRSALRTLGSVKDRDDVTRDVTTRLRAALTAFVEDDASMTDRDEPVSHRTRPHAASRDEGEDSAAGAPGTTQPVVPEVGHDVQAGTATP